MDGQSAPTVVPGGYRLGQRLRKGQDADLYEAFHPRIPGRYIVKLLSRAHAHDAKEIKAFRTDAQVAASVRHPNIVQVYDINQLPDGRPFVVMEHLDGMDLETRLAGDAALPLGETLSIVKGIASGLQAAHAKGVVHRDLRPENVFLVAVEGHEGGFVKILNFGMSNLRSAALMGGGSNVHFAGTPHYMAPEQALGQLGEVDGQTDQFALGAIAFRMLSGAQAFRGDDALAVLYQIVHEKPRSLGLRSTAPPAVEAVIVRALSKRKAERYQSVLDFARALEAAASQPTEVFTAPTPVRGVDSSQGADVQLPPGVVDDGPGGIADDEFQDFDDLRVPRRLWPRRLAMFILLGGGAAAGVWFQGWRLPAEWRAHPVWHTLGMPHAVSQSAPQVVAPVIARDAAVGAPADAAVVGVDAQGVPDAGVDAQERPEAEPTTPIAQQGQDPPLPKPAAKRRKKAASRPAKARNYIWSDKEQRLVPVEGSGLPLPGLGTP